MAGYVGTKAVLLSTTAANVGGDADIGGAASVGAGLTVDADGSTVLTVDRATTDGTVIDVQKNGSNVGSIASDAGSLDFMVIGQDEVGLGFVTDAVDAGNSRVIPRQINNTVASNGVIDLGDTGSRFRDLHLSRRILYDGTNTRHIIGSAYNSFNNISSTTTNSVWTAASGSSFTYTPQRSDTTVAIFADVNLGYAWTNPSGTNHGYIAATIVLTNGTGTYYSSEMEHWGRVDNFSGVLELTANHIEEYHASSAVNDGSTMTISIQYKRVATAGAGPSRGGVNAWGSNSIITVEEYI
jgi:hypothetical protein